MGGWGRSVASLGEQSVNLLQWYISYSVQCYEAADPSNFQTIDIILFSIQLKKNNKILYIKAAAHYHADDSYFKNRRKTMGILQVYLKYSKCKVLKKSQ